jgi:ferredoxin
MRVLADQDTCIASGACVLAAPDMFGQDDEGIVTVIAPTVTEERSASAIRAVHGCPAAALRLDASQP